MNIISFQSLALATLCFLSAACGSNNGGGSPGAVQAAAANVRNEKVTCTMETVMRTKRNGEPETKTLETSSVVAFRKVETSADGSAEVSDVNGERTDETFTIVGDEKQSILKGAYGYVSRRNSEKTQVPDGTTKEVSRIKTTYTYKDGRKFINAKGQESEIRETQNTSESIYKVVGNQTFYISSTFNGELLLGKYVTTTTETNGVNTEVSELLEPYTELGASRSTSTEITEPDKSEVTTVVTTETEITVESDKQICTSQIQN